MIIGKGYTFNEELKSLEIDYNECKYLMLVKTDSKENNNKFYELTVTTSGEITARYGRVGVEGVKIVVGSSMKDFYSKAKSKISKGYYPVNVINTVNGSNSKTLLDIAKFDLIKNKDEEAELEKLIKELIEHNKYEITTMSGGQINISDDGLVKTQLGVLDLSSIISGRKKLDSIQEIIKKIVTQDNWDKYIETSNISFLKYDENKLPEEYFDLLNSYFKLIPQEVNVNQGRNWGKTIFIQERYCFTKQYDFLNKLEESVLAYEALAKKEHKNVTEDENYEPVFDFKIEIETDKKVIKQINDLFNSTKNSIHTSNNLKLKRIYKLTNDQMKERFDKKADKGNIQLYWHGSLKFNILSILRQGLIIPKQNSNYTFNGRMFGDGVYFSDQSTKALNYASGYWNNRNEKNCFMFLSDVIMGKVCMADKVNTGRFPVYPIKGYDSVMANGGKINMTNSGHKSNLRNNEMIVYDLDQINLRYLCEFE